MVEKLRQRRNYALKRLNGIEGFSCAKPEGAFYVFPKFDLPLDDGALGEKLLAEAKIAVTPGSAFGAAGAGHLRLSYAASRETIEEGVRRLGEALARV